GIRFPRSVLSPPLPPWPVLFPNLELNRGSPPMKRSLIAIALAASLPFAANAAEGVTYNYVEGGYKASNGDIDADGYAANASFSFHPNFHVFGGLGSQEIDHTNRDVDQ